MNSFVTKWCAQSRNLLNGSSRFMSTIPTYNFNIQSEDDFKKRVLNSDTPVIVDFFATWCNPCKLLAPRIEHVVDEKRGRVLLAKVDIDELADLAIDHKVSSVPVLLAFKKGKPGEQMVGLQDEDKLRAFVNRLIGE